MTDTVENTAPENETKAPAEDKVVAPKTVEDLQNLKALKSTEASESYANFMNKHLAHIEGFHMTGEQAWTVIYGHRVWQQSEERAAEKVALKEAAETEKVEKAKAREEAKAKREAEKAEKAEEKAKKDAEKKAAKEAKDAEKAAKEAAKANSDSDLDSADAEGDGPITPSKRVRKARPAATADEAPAEAESSEPAEVDGF